MNIRLKKETKDEMLDAIKILQRASQTGEIRRNDLIRINNGLLHTLIDYIESINEGPEDIYLSVYRALMLMKNFR